MTPIDRDALAMRLGAVLSHPTESPSESLYYLIRSADQVARHLATYAEDARIDKHDIDAECVEGLAALLQLALNGALVLSDCINEASAKAGGAGGAT